jgi:type IV secretory pathway TraG/TraD family ATPase VirD4
MSSSTTSQTTSFAANASSNLFKALTPTNSLLLLTCLAGFVILSLVEGNKKKSATGYFSRGSEQAAARRQAKKQMKGRKRNSVALYIGSRSAFIKQPLYLPDAQRGTAVCGGPGSGKTFSVIDPAVRSALDQGFPVILYDFKYPTQTSRIAGHAARLGYNVRVFAPGFKESDTCNPLDFLKNETDSLMARQMAEVLNKNFASGGATKSEDPFFTQAGDQLTEAMFMLAKSTPYPDIMMCQALLSMDDLPGRLSAKEDLNPWVRSSFGQLMSVAQSEKTVASIVATAATNFTRFMKQEVLGAFCGETTIPLDLKGKQLLVFGLDRERRDVISPLIATVLHMIVMRNTVKKREDPLILALDELPTLYLPALVQWLNENREDGLVCMLGFQNMAQLQKTYGEELARAVLGGCATKAIFNPQEYESAQMFSDFMGEEEIRYKQRSRGSSDGKGSINISDQDKTRKLFEPSRFLKLPTGQCVLINPGYRNSKEASVPIHQNIRLPRAELEAVKQSEETWERLRKRLVKQQKGRSLPTSEDLKKRYRATEDMFPGKKSQGSAQQIDVNKLVEELKKRQGSQSA